MNKFKVGDNVKVTASNRTLKVYGCNPEIKNGSLHVITSISNTSCNLDYLLSGYVLADYLELAKPKWTIYNNTLPWSELSDKQKGKLLLAKLNNFAVCIVVKSLRGDDTFINNIEIIDNSGECVYRAQPKPVKPEPTMAELSMADLSECNTGQLKHIPEPMIAKGCTKSCK